MGLLKKAGKATGKFAVGVGKLAVKEAKTQYKDSQRKKRIVNRMEMKDLKGLGDAYGVALPNFVMEEDPLTGERTKELLTRSDFVARIMDALSLEQVEAYCNKRRLNTT